MGKLAVATTLILCAAVTLFRSSEWLPSPTFAATESALGEQSAAAHAPCTVFVTLSPECPISNRYLPTLNHLSREFAGKGVQFCGLIPDGRLTSDRVVQYAERHDIAFPVIVDHDCRVCCRLGATHMPQAVLTGPDGGVLYSGRIDDRSVKVAATRKPVDDQSLVSALNQYLSGQPIAPASTPVVGCLIEYSPQTPATGSITWANQIAPIIFEKCTRCHRPGEAAPFVLLSSEDARSHARQIRDVVQQRVMPPWKPKSGFGTFRNDCSLSEEQIDLISTWVANGMPDGPAESQPSPPEFAVGWQLGEPDLEVVMPDAFDVPADGPDIYQHFVIPSGLLENKLVEAFEFRPGAPEVVHHAFVYLDTTGRARKLDAEEPGPGYSRIGTPGFPVTGSLGGWGPGGLPRRLPLGMGRPMPKGSDVLLQIHYHPVGRRVRDRSRVGIYFAADWSPKYVTDIMVCNVDLRIPANADRHVHRSHWTLPVDTTLIDCTPHMHTLGRRIQAYAVTPGGKEVPLVQIDDWDFYWQDSYVFEQPVRLPAGTVMHVNCVFDNSADNPLNPHRPPIDVLWGDFSTDEMGICYFQATTDTLADFKTLCHASTSFFQAEWNRYQAHLKLEDTSPAARLKQ